MSSELSDALNPYFTQPRNSRPSSVHYPQQLQPVIQPSQQYVPHRSELEMAISEPMYAPVSQPQTSSDTIQELLRVVTQTNQAQENERKRRLAWEQEQEERYAQRQAELEKQMMEMRQEIYTLRSAFAAGPQPIPHQPTIMTHAPYYSPISPISQNSDMFVQGSSSRPIQPEIVSNYSMSISPPYDSPISTAPPKSASPSISPMLGPVNNAGTSVPPSPGTSPDRARKRYNDTIDYGHDSDRSASSENLAQSRNHYQRKCRTIQQAMRSHILRLMCVEEEQNLPDSQPEGVAHDPSQPLRFVWDKTTKQSVHNTRMKAFVLEDIKRNRQLYTELSEREFSKDVLESAFEQSFTTLRQRFKAQGNVNDAKALKSKGDQRAQNARRSARRKKKLNDRSAARLKIPIFEHVAFDGALQLECMSSEESDDDADPTQPKFVYTRGYLWRSNRLLRFFHSLDQEGNASSSAKRGNAPMNRAIGIPKESVGLPPNGVSNWMISRRWIRATQSKQPDLAEALKRLVSNSSELPPETLYRLGEESDDDEEEEREVQQGTQQVPQHYSSSSLHNALA
ncbi:hypothetical protein BT96DRAFT_913015 [Gymnopus androsaceus JB14]|uniref:Uncharacterized protein n=1 Tax=Gymnopus androsaceus JB14 TaxID=1447944 RepID=A0A6A4IMA1_9AGAR|nr:hypothetical protein BT96DRAFT_913015 [Gymnopus androsaceus JB14]